MAAFRRSQEGGDDTFVLLAGDRAGGIDESATGSSEATDAHENALLERRKGQDVLLPYPPDDLRMAAQRTKTGAGSIYDHNS